MNYYALLVALVILFALLLRGYREKNLKYIIVSSLLLFALMGLRDAYSIGCDTRTSYLANFRAAVDQPWSYYMQGDLTDNRLFFLVMKFFVEYVSTDYQLFIAAHAAFVCLCFGHMLYRHSPNPLQSILYYFGLLLYMFHFSGLKQSIAMCILMLAFDAVVDRKPVKFLLLVFLATQFHFPALVFLPVYLLPVLKLEKHFLLLLAALLVFTYLFRNRIITFMYSMYKDDSPETIDMSGLGFLRTKALIMLVIVVASFVFRKPTHEDSVYVLLLELTGISIVFQTFCGYNNIFERLADYYFQFSVLLIPMVFDRRAKRKGMFNWRLIETIDTVAPYLFCGFAIYRFLDYVARYWFFTPYRFFF